VADRGDVVRPGVVVDQREHLRDAGHEAVGRISGGRRRLRRHEQAGVLVERDDVGERAAGVDADADAPARSGHGVHSTGPSPSAPSAPASHAGPSGSGS
jgi:hypothetical protein